MIRGGAVGAAYIGALAGYPNVIGFDMGGTSTDVSLLQAGDLPRPLARPFLASSTAKSAFDNTAKA